MGRYNSTKKNGPPFPFPPPPARLKLFGENSKFNKLTS